MSDTKDTDDKPLSVERKPTLSLKRNVEQGTVRQSFSHGRSKSVVVETKKKRRPLGLPGDKPEGKASSSDGETPVVKVRPRSGAAPSRGTNRTKAPDSNEARTLTNSEREARERVLRQAAERDREEAEKRAENEARERAIAEERRKREAEEAAAAGEPLPSEDDADTTVDAPGDLVAETGPSADQGHSSSPPQMDAALETARAPAAEGAGSDAPQEAEVDAAGLPQDAEQTASALAPRGVQIVSQPRHIRAAKAEAAERKRQSDAAAAAPDVAALEAAAAKAGTGKAAARAKPTEDDEASGAKTLRPVKRPRGGEEAAKPARSRTGDDRRRSKLTITSALSDDEERGRSLAAARRRREREKAKAMGAQTPREKVTREVIIPETITIQELANRMAERAVDVIKLLMKQGQMLKINDVIDADTAELIVDELGHTAKRVAEADVEEGLFDEADSDDHLAPRPPVVTIMGHVDHGKTSLLDALREANVVAGEAGGITQHIGAYQVEKNDQLITFIDTPGHAAFTAMRARGAKATDIVILVVAADDGVMPQTIEAINHARAASVPIIVAINKIDKEGADPNRVRTELLQHEIVVESMGGEVLDVEVSALQKLNLEGILDAILLQAEILELTANPDRPGEGTVVEAQLDKGRGPVATVLVQRGQLTVGDILVAGSEWGRVRALIDDHGDQVKSAGPSKPVEILGMQATPEAGDRFAVVENEARAREVTEYRQRKRREQAQVRGGRGSLEQMMSQLKESDLQEVPILIKGDVQGSVEAIVGALEKLSTDEVAVRVIHSGVGGITESDITLASASEAAIIGFNVRANKQARDAADQTGSDIRYYNIIYDLVDDVKAAMSGMLSPERRETFIGYAEILQVFDISKVGKVAGCRVTDGTVERGAGVRLLRDDVVIHEGKLAILKRFKDEVKEVVSGQECGMMFENYQDIREGDQIECFRVEEIARTL